MPAVLVPDPSTHEFAHETEELVASELMRQLPDGAYVFHSRRRTDATTDNGQLRYREGETDFIILHPTSGLLVLEVKGFIPRYDEADGCYRHGDGSPLRESPLAQAQRNMRSVVDGLGGGSSLGIPYGYAVIYPTGKLEEADRLRQEAAAAGLTPGQAAPEGLLLTSKDMPQLAVRVQQILRGWNSGSGRLNPDRVEAIRRLLMPSPGVTESLSATLSLLSRKLVQLTDEQKRVLDNLGHRPRVAVQGIAGSGKTMLAIEQARRFAATERRTLLLGFNRHLVEWITQALDAAVGIENGLTQAERDRITVETFCRFAARYCDRAGVPCDLDWMKRQSEGDDDLATPPEASPPEAGSTDAIDDDRRGQTALSLIDAAAARPEARFDAIILDEGQDFTPEWIETLENLLADDGQLFLFYDQNQNLFDGFDAKMAEFYDHVLTRNCRNTAEVAAACEAISGIVVPRHADMPVGPSVARRTIPDPAKRTEAAIAQLETWVNRDGLDPSQIAVLSPLGSDSEDGTLMTSPRAGKVRLTSDLTRWHRNSGVLATSVRRFKGLEADAVLLVDTRPPGPQRSYTDRDLYVAASRGRLQLVELAAG